MTKKEVKVKKVSLEVIVPDNVESTIKGKILILSILFSTQ